MASGGKRDGAGRKAGTPNKASIERQKAIAEAGLTPLDYMLGILRDEKQPDEKRAWAAEKAAPYVHPKLAAVEHSGKDGGPIDVVTEIRRIIVDPASSHRSRVPTAS